MDTHLTFVVKWAVHFSKAIADGVVGQALAEPIFLGKNYLHASSSCQCCCNNKLPQLLSKY